MLLSREGDRSGGRTTVIVDFAAALKQAAAGAHVITDHGIDHRREGIAFPRMLIPTNVSDRFPADYHADTLIEWRVVKSDPHASPLKSERPTEETQEDPDGLALSNLAGGALLIAANARPPPQ